LNLGLENNGLHSIQSWVEVLVYTAAHVHVFLMNFIAMMTFKYTHEKDISSNLTISFPMELFLNA
jgi:hypothetical protein